MKKKPDARNHKTLIIRRKIVTPQFVRDGHLHKIISYTSDDWKIFKDKGNVSDPGRALIWPPPDVFIGQVDHCVSRLKVMSVFIWYFECIIFVINIFRFIAILVSNFVVNNKT